MRERAVRIGSAGKTFSLTGWKVGLCDGGSRTAEADRQGPPVPDLHHAAQPAGGCGDGLRKDDGYFDIWPPTCRPSAIGWPMRWRISASSVLPAHGTYFVTADFRPLGFNGDDVASAVTSDGGGGRHRDPRQRLL